jgi:hypothetical protein
VDCQQQLAGRFCRNRLKEALKKVVDAVQMNYVGTDGTNQVKEIFMSRFAF